MGRMTTVRRLVVGKLEPVIIDPRRHDAVLFALQALATDTTWESTVTLVRQLQEIGVGTAVFSSNPDGDNVLTAAGLGDLFSVCAAGPVSTDFLRSTYTGPLDLFSTATSTRLLAKARS